LARFQHSCWVNDSFPPKAAISSLASTTALQSTLRVPGRARRFVIELRVEPRKRLSETDLEFAF
jgi:hypothetical protein